LGKLFFTGIGNIEAMILGEIEPIRLISRRGVVGVNAPHPHIIEQAWEAKNIAILHSDGLISRWHWEDFSHLVDKPAQVIAQNLLNALAREDDDATVVIIRGKV
jgi:serine/threonine protein phosphatase PrpC